MKAAIYNRKTLPDLLNSAAENYPGKGIGFVQSDGSIKTVRYPELLSQALSFAANMQESGMKPGDKAMIVMSRNEDIVNAAWACFMGGWLPTILQPPVTFTEFNQPAKKIENVFRVLENPWIIISEDLASVFRSDSFPAERILIMASPDGPARPFTRPEIAEDGIAFIQFSSGSTGDPKGIMLTHLNILTNLAAISVGLDIYDTDIMNNWMPLYHDMGFFGFHLTPVFAGSDHYLIDPVEFIKRPGIWLDTMEKTRCSITGCPNFGQALLLRYMKNREIKVWDLSALKAIVNGAEPISTRIMSEFMGKLASSKLRKEAMMPAYGMAEATLAITFYDLWKEPVITSFNRTRLQSESYAVPETKNHHEMLELVSVGKALENIEVRVVDDEGKEVEMQHAGHIRIRGKSITRGYYNNPAETTGSFAGGWLITGDRGFFYNGELYITGRVKDIIFVNGQNLYAHDLENLASKHADIPYGKVIVGGVFDQKKGKDLIILFLVGSPNRALCDQFLDLKKFFRDVYGLGIDVFVPVKSNQVPKTSSGKIQRYKLIGDYQNGVFDEAVSEIKKLIN
ncbi:MAG: AMP-binding protein [Bacteroidales bacterium]|jgi:acyl-CoA synthetase (AMP-forming)/AMP-acid ligase II|nr:AMP-binding protein [Bacteroidales bacterium]